MNRIDELVPAVQQTPDTPSTRFLAADIMEKRGFNPIEKLINLAEELEAKDIELDLPINAEKRFKIYTALAKYYAPQPKSVDINLNSTSSSTFQIVSYTGLAKEREQFIPPQSVFTGPQLMDVIEAVVVEDAD